MSHNAVSAELTSNGLSYALYVGNGDMPSDLSMAWASRVRIFSPSIRISQESTRIT